MKAIGTNTADSTTPMPTRAPVIWSIDLRVASSGDSPSSDMMRSTFSTTTMASSTSRPIASTIANMVSMFTEKHNSEEHTSELQSLMRHSYAVFRLKQKKTT